MQDRTPPNDAALDLLVSCCCEQTDTPTADLAAKVVADVRRLREALRFCVEALSAGGDWHDEAALKAARDALGDA